MPRIRTIQPGFPKSPSMGRVSREARLLFVQLWVAADDAGRLGADLQTLADQLYPHDTDVPMLLVGWLDELAREGCIERYGGVGGDYLRIVRWRKYQNIAHPTPSRLPPSAAEQAFREIHEASRNSRAARAADANLLDHNDDSGSAAEFHEGLDSTSDAPDTPDAVMRDLARIQRDSHAAESFAAALRSVELRGRRLGMWAARGEKQDKPPPDDPLAGSVPLLDLFSDEEKGIAPKPPT